MAIVGQAWAMSLSVVNGGCGFVGRPPHPSPSFIAPHPTVYETSRATWRKKIPMDEILANEKWCLQDERVDCSSGCMRAFVWNFWSSQRVPKVFNGVPIISSTSPFNEGLSLKIFILDSQVDGGGVFIQHEVFQAYPRGREARNWGNIGAFRSLRLQSTAEMFLAHKLMGGCIHNTSMTQNLERIASPPVWHKESNIAQLHSPVTLESLGP